MRRLSRLILASVALGVLAAASARAQTQADIQDQLDAMNRRLEQLERENQELRERLERTETAAKAPSKAPLVIESGNDKVKVGLSGHVNQAVMFASDGERTNVNIVDNDASSSRFRITGEAQPFDELEVGLLYEADFRVNASGSVTNDGDIANSNGSYRTRKVEVTFAGPSWGQLSLGKGDTASNSVTEIDLSGTDFTGTYSSITDMAGGFEFVDDATGELSGVAIGDAAGNIDGFGRAARIRYDTPAVYGFTASTSYAQESRYDVALRYANQFEALGGVKLAGGIAYFAQPRADAFNKGQGDRPDSRADTRGFSGSVSALHASGANFTVAGGTENDKLRDGDDPFYFYLKPGYRTDDIFAFGETAFSIDYGRFYNFASGTADGRLNTVGLSAVQNLDAAATEFYLAGRWHGYDERDRDFKDLFVMLTGARVKF